MNKVGTTECRVGRQHEKDTFHVSGGGFVFLEGDTQCQGTSEALKIPPLDIPDIAVRLPKRAKPYPRQSIRRRRPMPKRPTGHGVHSQRKITYGVIRSARSTDWAFKQHAKLHRIQGSNGIAQPTDSWLIHEAQSC